MQISARFGKQNSIVAPGFPLRKKTEAIKTGRFLSECLENGSSPYTFLIYMVMLCTNSALLFLGLGR